MNSKFPTIPPQKIKAWVAKHFSFKEKSNGELVIANPFYANDKMKFNISLTKSCCHDWRGDEWAGPVNPETGKRNCSFIKFIRIYRKCSYHEALKEVLGASADVRYYLKPENRLTDLEAKGKAVIALPHGTEPLISSTDRQAKILIHWLGTRGYSKDDIVKNDLHHFGMDVYWPYYEFDTLVYWQSRSRLNKKFKFPSLDVCDENGKIIGKADGAKGDFLYGFDDIEPASYVIITEAIFDKHTLGKQALASGGAVLTKKQIGKLKILGPRNGVILSPDNDAAGLKSVVYNYQLLISYGFTVYYSIPPLLEYENDGIKCVTKDWNDIGQFVVGFDKVRELHDNGIKKITEESLVELVY